MINIDNKLEILIIDDDEMIRKLLSVLLRMLNCNVTECNNGNEGCKEFTKNRYDLIFMDLVMPVMDGITCCSIFRENEAHSGEPFKTPIIGITGGSDEEVKECLKAGMTDVIKKPFSKKSIVNTLKIHTNCVEFISNKGEILMGKTICFQKELALEVLDGNEEMFHSMVEIFRETAPELSEDIDIATQEKDTEYLKRTAHTLKTRALYVGGKILSDLALKVEMACKSENPQQAFDLTPKLTEELNKLQKTLEEID